LAAAGDYLLEHFRSAGTWDLSHLIVVVPGGRAGRRLLEILVELADLQKLAFSPPMIVTVGKLPELLYQAKWPFASDLVQQLTWSEALRRTEPETLSRLLASPPPEQDLMTWLSLGDMLGRVHRELAADGLDFAEVVRCGQQIGEFRETPRWKALEAVQRAYLDTLNNLHLWDVQTARLIAVRQKECRSDAPIVLLGTVDLNKIQRKMLDLLPGKVTALVFAPEDLADRFDEHGCLRPEAWHDVTIPVSDDQIEVADSPSDQAAAALRALAALDGRYSGEQITLGVPDRQVVPLLEQHLRQCDLPSRDAAGLPISQTAPFRLIDVVADFLEGRRFSAFAALVRHPAITEWLALDTTICGDWLSELDCYHGEHLPYQLGGSWLGDGRACANLKKVCQAIDRLLEPFEGSRPLGAWGAPIVDLLVEVFGRSPLDQTVEPDRTILAACEKLCGTLREHDDVPEVLAPTVTGAEALRLLRRRVEGDAIPPVARRGDVELLGWLELPLDDAPVLIVTGFNEGRIPVSLNADLFLPNQMRRALGIEDNDRRYARDAYALTMLIHSRPHLKLIVGRRTAEGDPLTPSRLLFACDDQTLARRVLRCFSPERSQSNPSLLPGALRPGQLASRFAIPQPRRLRRPITSMRVTEFKDYLGCPYRYYLKHQLKLDALADAADELDGASFGSLAHLALREFALGKAANSTNIEEILAWLNEGLDRAVAEQYGKTPLAAIRVQVEQLRRRLLAFASWQADWARQGWQIEYAETGPEDGKAHLMVDGEPMMLRGRIDRIDVNAESGERIIFDYKFSDRAMSPERTHVSDDQWVDLQLPLYRHLVRGMSVEGPVGLGYIVLPKDTSRVGHLLAGWSDADLHDADLAAEDVVRKVRQQVFWPPAKTPPPFSEIFAAICQDDQFGALAAMLEEEGGAES